jgi:hypothetical protein
MKTRILIFALLILTFLLLPACSILKSRFDRCADLLEQTDGMGSLKIIENGKFKYYCGKENEKDIY